MRRRGNSGAPKFILALIVVALICGGVYYLFTSKTFERNKPQVDIKEKIYWNLKTPLAINVKDDSGIKQIKITMQEGDNIIPLMNEKFDLVKNDLNLQINFPKGLIYNKNAAYRLSIEASDVSKWNFFMGNKTSIVSEVIVDQKKPDVYVVDQSYKITKGGSATVVFGAKDESLTEVYVETNFGKRFIVTPFVKDGYYATLLAWPAKIDNFAAFVVAKDLAGNETKRRIPFFLQDKKYKTSTIELKKDFIDGKITDIAEHYVENINELSDLDKFKFVNETLREKNEGLIHTESSKVPETKIDNFFLKAFYPLKGGKAVAGFGDYRTYTKNDVKVSESQHLGIDLASTTNAQILQNNPGKVVIAQEDGIYGLTALVYHGFGVYTLYSHCSNLNVQVGDEVKPGDILGNTGSSGLAFGDHLHFGVIVQGIEVRPEEWMDNKWMQENIYKILENSKKVIENEK